MTRHEIGREFKPCGEGRFLDGRLENGDSPEIMLNEEGLLIWVTGLAGSGKTTLAQELTRRLKSRGQNVVLLDGDELRDVTGGVFGYSPEDRLKCAQFYGRLCTLLVTQGATVICSTISMFESVRAENRARNSKYFEIFLKASPAFLRGRDKKGLYSTDDAQSVMGRGIPAEEPAHSDLVFDLDQSQPSVTEMAARVERDLEQKFGWRSHEVQY